MGRYELHFSQAEDVKRELNNISEEMKQAASDLGKEIGRIQGSGFGIPNIKSELRTQQNKLLTQYAYLKMLNDCLREVIERTREADDKVLRQLQVQEIKTDSSSSVDGIASISQLDESGGINWAELLSVLTSGELGDLLGQDLPGSLGWVSDMGSILEAIKNNDVEKLKDFGVKGLEDVLDKVYGISGFTAKGYSTIAVELVDNLIDGLEIYGNDPNVLRGFTGYLFHATAGTLWESGVDIAYDFVDDVGKIFNYDINQVYKDLTGKDGVEGFYAASGRLVHETIGKYYEGRDFLGALQGTGEMIGDSISWYGKQIGKFFDKIF